jgi:D-alanyl-D-alanine carboxypeptidase (penicillin-binding protein 5/6)
MDGYTGKLLYAQNPLVHRPPASLTKMTAAIVLIENGKLTDTVTTPAAVTGTPESSLHLSPGETISLHDLLYAMMLRSANDTPIAGAYYLCGGIPPFVDLMNAKVVSIGCANTHFVTPNGLYADGHYSCAYDLALIARYGLNNLPIFREIVKTRKYRVTRSVHKDDSLVTNTAMTFLTDFPDADGVKTGYISQAGHCFVGSATRKRTQFIAVALDSPKCRSDVVQMLSYGFAHFKDRVIFKQGYSTGRVSISGVEISTRTSADLDDVAETGKLSPTLNSYRVVTTATATSSRAGIAVGNSVGKVTLYQGNTPIMSVDALALQAVPASSSFFRSGPTGARSWIRTAAYFAFTLVASALIYFCWRILEIGIHARKIAKDSRLRRTGVTPDSRNMDS